MRRLAAVWAAAAVLGAGAGQAVAADPGDIVDCSRMVPFTDTLDAAIKASSHEEVLRDTLELAARYRTEGKLEKRLWAAVGIFYVAALKEGASVQDAFAVAAGFCEGLNIGIGEYRAFTAR